MLISIIGYIVLIIPTSGPRLRYGFLCVAMIGAGTPNPLVAAWLSSNTPDKATRAIVMGLFGWANLAGVVAGQIWLSEYAPTYRVPLMITMILVAIGIVGFLFMRGVYMYANYKRRRLVATWTPEQLEEEKRSTTRRGHEKRYFVYSY
jgi:MFS family permease